MEKGSFFKIFKENDLIVYGYIVSLNSDSIDYVRESMTRWNCEKSSILNFGKRISFDEFCNAVRKNAFENGVDNVNNDEIQMALNHYDKNWNCDFEEILTIMA